MLLRASNQDPEATLNLRAIVDGVDTDSGVPAGAELLRFVDASLTGSPDLTQARTELVTAVGAEAMVDAAAVIGNFQRMVRIADGTGIVLDAMLDDGSKDIRAALQLQSFASARLAD